MNETINKAKWVFHMGAHPPALSRDSHNTRTKITAHGSRYTPRTETRIDGNAAAPTWRLLIVSTELYLWRAAIRGMVLWSTVIRVFVQTPLQLVSSNIQSLGSGDPCSHICLHKVISSTSLTLSSRSCFVKTLPGSGLH